MKTIIMIGIPVGKGSSVPLDSFIPKTITSNGVFNEQSGIDIFNQFSNLGFDLLMPFPVTPTEYEIVPSTYKYEKITPINNQDMLIPGNKSSTLISFDGFIPKKAASYAIPFALKGDSFVGFLDFCRNEGVPLKIWFSNKLTIYDGFITELSYKSKNNGDIEYSLKFEESPLIKNNKIKEL